MFSLAQPAFYPSYNPYEQLLLQQELQRRRQVEAYLRQQREAEELERRRAYERAVLQAEYERRCAAEYERRRRAEAECLRRHSMFDGGMQDLFDAIYGRARSGSPQREDVRKEQDVTVNDKPAPQTPQALPAPTPPPASEPVPSVPENEQTKDAAPQIDTAPSLTAVQSALASFASLQSSFTFPEHLDFFPSSSKLAYTPNNAPLHGYEHALTGLLTQLDAVESFGDDEVRKARKEAVKAIELELEKLDESKVEAWKKQAQPEPVVPVPEVTPLGPMVVSPEPESAPSEMEVDPVTVPLPQDSDEDVSEAVVDSDEHSAAEVVISAESSVPTPEVVSTLVQSPIVEDLPPLPSSPELLSRSLSSPSPSDSGDAKSDLELEEYIEVGNVAPASETDLEAEAEEEAVEKDQDLELMRDWDFEF